MRNALSDPATHTVYRFGHSAFDVRRGVLLVDGAERRLRPKSFALLRFMVENAGRLLDRDEIMRVVWPEVIVTDDSITQCIKEIRRAIDDNESRIVRTIPKRGYMFVAEIPPDPSAAAEAPVARTSAPPLPDKPSIAVLPFQNMSGDPEQEYFADGMVEEITTAVSRIRWLFVIARSSSFVYKGHAVDIRQVSRELGVRYVLEGSVRKSGTRVRVTAQLIDAVGGTHLWADRYDREINDIFAVQDDIAATVAAIIEPTLTEAEQQRALRKPPERLDIWETWQRGMWHFHKFGAAGNKTAQQYFRQTIDLDPTFAPGHYSHALAVFCDYLLYSTRPYAEVAALPLDEARHAVTLDERDAMAHAVLALQIVARGESEQAIAEARAAVALNPNNAFALSILGDALGYGGYPREALEQLRRAIRASPHDPLIWLWKYWIGAFQFFARDFAAAAETLTEVTRLRPDWSGPLVYLVGAQAMLGRVDATRQALEHMRARFPENLPRFYHNRPPWQRQDHWALRMEALALADRMSETPVSDTRHQSAIA